MCVCIPLSPVHMCVFACIYAYLCNLWPGMCVCSSVYLSPVGASAQACGPVTLGSCVSPGVSPPAAYASLRQFAAVL